MNFNHFIWQFILWWFDKYIQVSSRLLTSLLSLKISHNAAKNRQHHYWDSKLSIIKTLLCSWKNTGSSYFPMSVVKLIVSGIFSFGYYLAPRWARAFKERSTPSAVTREKKPEHRYSPGGFSSPPTVFLLSTSAAPVSPRAHSWRRKTTGDIFAFKV